MSKFRYNGMKLPDINTVWTDKETYPYALISVGYGDGYDSVQLYFFSTKHHLDYVVADNDIRIVIPKGETYIQWHNYASSKIDEIEAYDSPFSPSERTATMTESVYATIVSNRGLWANYDILNADGSLYLAASDPVPVPDEPEQPDEPEPVLSWQKHDAYKPNAKWDGNTFYRVTGGKWVKQGAMNPSVVVEDEPTGDPIAYLYNGVRLPDINTVWTDKEAYPYAYLTDEGSGGAYAILIFCNKDWYYNTAIGTPCVDAPVSGITYAYASNNEIAAEIGIDNIGEWVFIDEQHNSGTGTRHMLESVSWSNTDILSTEGSVYLAASEPVPVYE